METETLSRRIVLMRRDLLAQSVAAEAEFTRLHDEKAPAHEKAIADARCQRISSAIKSLGDLQLGDIND